MGPNFRVWLAVDKNFHLRSTGEKMGAFAGFTKKNLRPNGCSTTNFMDGVNCANSITDKIIEIQIILMQF